MYRLAYSIYSACYTDFSLIQECALNVFSLQGDFEWSDGSGFFWNETDGVGNIIANNWGPGQPDNWDSTQVGGSREDCGEMRLGDEHRDWNDRACSDLTQSVCEIRTFCFPFAYLFVPECSLVPFEVVLC